MDDAAGRGDGGIAAGDVDKPDVVAEVRAAFAAYEAALVANDVASLDEWFWRDPRAVRFGVAESLYGHAAIAAWRATAVPVPATRRIHELRITTFGADLAIADCEFSNGPGHGGRQSQTWVRVPAGWRIVSAHVSAPSAGT